MKYKLYKTDSSKINANAAITVGIEPVVSFIFDPANTDYQAYLVWLSEGNTPLPADEPVVEEPTPVVEAPLPVVVDEAAPVDEPVVPEPVIEPVVDEPVVPEPVIEPVVDEPVVPEPLVDEPGI